MELMRLLDELATTVEQARAMPMSSSCIVNRPQVLGLIGQIDSLLPRELREAEHLLASADQVVQDARAEAATILADAHAERERLVTDHEVYLAAIRAADEVREQAESEARRMRAEVDDYVDRKLANFEVALQRTLDAVVTGRERIGERAADDQSGPGRPMRGPVLPDS